MCPGCQATNDSDWAFCQQCGTRLTPQQQPAAGAPPQPAWGAPTVVTPAPPGADAQPVWGAPTVVTPAPDFGQQPPPAPPQNMPPAWGAPTVVTPAPPQGGAPPQQNWGAPTVITPSPDFGQPPVQQPPPAWGAPTVVTPAPPQSFGNAPLSDQQFVPTVVAPPAQDPNAYPETIVTPPVPEQPPAPEAAAPAPAPRPEPEPAPAPPAPQSAGGGSTQDISRPAQPPAAPPGGQSTVVMHSTPVAVPPKQAKLLLIMEGGEVGETFGLRPAETVIGRVDGDVKFPHDGYMSSRHARILQRNGRFFLIDNNSRNGTFVKIHQEVELHPGDVILVGKQLFRFETDE
jgi:hypothetical protein